MSRWIAVGFLLFFTSFADAKSWWPWGDEPEAPACHGPMDATEIRRKMTSAVPRDLIADWRDSLTRYSPRELAAKNQQTLQEAACLPSGPTRGRRVGINRDWATRIVDSIARHPIVAETETRRYNRHPGVEIGFCFGRATYTHLMLLHLGVLKDSIKKVWAVGNLNSGNLVWQFHVATIVRSETPGAWWVLDSYFGQPLELAEWSERMASLDPGGQMLLTLTDPDKFSVQLGTYDRVQLGLDLPPGQDWYAGYFRELMKWFAAGPDLESLGLPDPSN